MINPLYLSPSILQRIASQVLVAGVLATTSLLSGLVPAFHNGTAKNLPVPIFSIAAYAQAISDDELQNYARSVLLIEPIRQAAYDEIKRIIGSRQVPSIACHRPNSLNNLPQNIRQIAVNYCNRATRIVERNNLSISRFNTITVNLQSDPNLALLIQQELMRLQQTDTP